LNRVVALDDAEDVGFFHDKDLLHHTRLAAELIADDNSVADREGHLDQPPGL
jgi:hypothetical protein